MARRIMYLGKQVNRHDNVNKDRRRTWAGLGDIVEVEDAQAKRLVAYHDVFADVTDMSEKDQNKMVKGLEERYRKEKQVTQGLTVENATITQLEERLAKLKADRDKPLTPPNMATLPDGPPATTLTDTPQARPQDDEAVQEQIIVAIGQLDKNDESLWTVNDEPTVDAIKEVLGYSITADERDEAWEALTVPDPTLD